MWYMIKYNWKRKRLHIYFDKYKLIVCFKNYVKGGFLNYVF